MSGSFLVKNKYLQKLLEKKGINTEAIWSSIVSRRGSVLHIKELSDYEKDIFKTAIEINQQWIIEHAAINSSSGRQSFFHRLQHPGQIHNMFEAVLGDDVVELRFRGIIFQIQALESYLFR